MTQIQPLLSRTNRNHQAPELLDSGSKRGPGARKVSAEQSGNRQITGSEASEKVTKHWANWVISFTTQYSFHRVVDSFFPAPPDSNHMTI